jgi:CHAD domain-containing protein
MANLEREVKLLAPPGYRLPSFDDVAVGVGAAPPVDEELKASYYDTTDLRLARWGVSLRYRTGEGAPRWTLKLPVDKSAHTLSRSELEFAGRAGPVPADAAKLVRAYVRTSSLERVARLTTRRRRVDLVDELGAPLATVCDDEVSVYDGRRLTARFRELEVEAVGAGGDLLDAVADRLRAAGAVAGEPVPKVVRALGPAILRQPEVPTLILGDDATAGDVVRVAIANSVAKLLRHDPFVRLGDDPEALHQARVATRRLRSDLRTFRSLVDETWATGLREQLSSLADLFGGVRDADVMLERLSGRVALMSAADQRAGRGLLGRLDGQRTRARTVLLATMDGPGYVELLESLLHAAEAPVLNPEAEQPAKPTLAVLVNRSWKHLDAAVAGLGVAPIDEDLHAVRIRAKRARYAADAAVPVWGSKAKKLASAAADVQTVLGELQDAVVAEDWLRRSGRASVAQSFLAGQLAAAEQSIMRQSRESFPAVWAKASSAKLRSWLR